MRKIHTLLSCAVFLASLSLPAAAQSPYGGAIDKGNVTAAAKHKVKSPPRLRQQAKVRRGAVAVAAAR